MSLTLSVTAPEMLVYSRVLAFIVRHERVPDESSGHPGRPRRPQGPTLRYGLEPMREQFLQLGDHAEKFLRDGGYCKGSTS